MHSSNCSMDCSQVEECSQQKHCLYFSQLQSMSRELPLKFQQRLTNDLLSSLANSLLDGTVFDIVSSLKEVQQLEEKNLNNQRAKLITQHKALKSEMMMRHQEALRACQTGPHQINYIKGQQDAEIEALMVRCNDEVKRKDMKIILDLDQKVMEQQSTLEKVGLPGFFVTNNALEVRLQMYLLDFIVRLSQLETS